MSEVISFILNEDNSREARALKILEKRKGKGHSIRHIITEGILSLEATPHNEVDTKLLFELGEKLDLMVKVIDQLSNDEKYCVKASETASSNMLLSDRFINSIRKTGKPGIRIENKD